MNIEHTTMQTAIVDLSRIDAMKGPSLVDRWLSR
jgi:hypothetical protein